MLREGFQLGSFEVIHQILQRSLPPGFGKQAALQPRSQVMLRMSYLLRVHLPRRSRLSVLRWSSLQPRQT
jgi:hypothetical protein